MGTESERAFDPASETWPDCEHPHRFIRPGIILAVDDPDELSADELRACTDQELTDEFGPQLCAGCAHSWLDYQISRGRIDQKEVLNCWENLLGICLAAARADVSPSIDPPQIIVRDSGNVVLDFLARDLFRLLEETNYLLRLHADGRAGDDEGVTNTMDRIRKIYRKIKRKKMLHAGNATVRSCPDGHPHLLPKPSGIQTFHDPAGPEDKATVKLTCPRCGFTVHYNSTEDPIYIEQEPERVM